MLSVRELPFENTTVYHFFFVHQYNEKFRTKLCFWKQRAKARNISTESREQQEKCRLKFLSSPNPYFFTISYTDKKNQILLIYKEIQSGAVAKSNMRKGFLIYEEMRK
jgi:hypothetical protein